MNTLLTIKKWVFTILLLSMALQSALANPTSKNEKERYKLFILIKKNLVPQSIEYIETYPEINRQSYKGRSPLIWAIENGRPAIVEALAQKGINLSTGYKDIPPLLFALYKSQYQCAEILIQHSISLWDADKSNTTPLIYAATTSNNTIAKLILKKGNNGVNKRDKTSLSALDWALSNKNAELAGLLLDKGATFKSGPHNNSWINFLETQNYTLITKLITKVSNMNITGDNGQTPLTIAAGLGDIELAKMIIKHGGDINKPNDAGKYPIHFAISAQNIKFVHFLIKNNANVDVQDAEGWTPLMLASALGFKRLVNGFLKKGVTVDRKDKTGKTALLYACLNGNAVIARKLIAHGADPKLSDGNSNNCQDLAKKENKKEILTLLKQHSK